jgi:hypothetical protein
LKSNLKGKKIIPNEKITIKIQKMVPQGSEKSHKKEIIVLK